MSSSFVTDKEFYPEIGKCYETRLGKINYQGSSRFFSTRIKVISGEGKINWADLETGKKFDKALFEFEVKEYKEMSHLEATTTPLQLYSQ
jgi:hypothetical protein